MKHVFCKRLAACLCIKRSPSSPLEPPQIYRRKTNFAVEDGDNMSPDYNDMTTSVARPTRNETSDKVMQEMHDMQKTRLHNEEQQRYEDDREKKIKNDWMLAAAVVDRICAIVFAIIFIAGTLIAVIASDV